MRKILIILLSLTFLFTSCVLSHPTIPYGVWKCDDPNLTLEIAPDDEVSNVKYVLEDGEKLDLTIAFNSLDYSFSIYKSPETYSGENAYFMGTHKLKKDKLYLELSEPFQIKTGYKKIILNKIESYDIPSEPLTTP